MNTRHPSRRSMRRRGVIFLRRSSLGAKFDRADFSKKSWTFFGAERCEDPSSEQFEQEPELGLKRNIIRKQAFSFIPTVVLGRSHLVPTTSALGDPGLTFFAANPSIPSPVTTTTGLENGWIDILPNQDIPGFLRCMD